MTNKFGDVFTNLTVAQILGDGLILGNASGQIKVKFSDLPPAIREKYQPLAAGAVEKQQTESERTAAYLARTEALQAQQAQQRVEREANEAAQAAAPSGGGQSGHGIQMVVIPVPNSDWKITIMNPGLDAIDRHVDGDELMERGIPGTNGCNLSLFVEPPATDGMSNDDVFNYYWARAAQDSHIEQSSVKAFRKEKFIVVVYTAQGVPNANYYFAYGGRWVDVHIWKWPFDPVADGELFTQFEANLSYGE